MRLGRVTMSPSSNISMAALRDRLRLSATIGVEQNNPILTPGVAKRASLTCHGEIAGRDELAPCRRGDAIHRRNDRLRRADDRQHQPGAGLHDLGKIGAPAIGIVPMRGQLLEVVTRGEG